MNFGRASLAGGFLLGVLLAAAPAGAQSPPAFAPNIVEISPSLTTSGQPPASSLASLRDRGYRSVIYLAPPTVPDAVRDEALIVGRQGLLYVNIPIKFDDPTEQDYEAFAAILRSVSNRKVLVHCQVNMRASTMVFLYRVLALKEDPRGAYDSVARIWSPEGPWKRLVQGLLRKHGVAFDPY
jgi:protein tyrosine phosphatase (PTP) superfamily phosphohydrolase (DUF442 family)